MLRQSLARVQGKKVTEKAADAQQGTADEFPRSLVMHELRGYPKGPLAYLRSRRSMADWSSAAGQSISSPAGSVAA